nr:hypothetical protein [Tanacetum cinerariifolium]
MQNLEGSLDLTTAMNTTLALLAQAFKVNTIPMNNNQRSSLIPRNSQIAQSRHQDANAPAEGNGNGIHGNLIRCHNCQREGHSVSNCTVKSRKWDAAYLRQQLQIAQEEEARIQSTQEEFEFITAADAHE